MKSRILLINALLSLGAGLQATDIFSHEYGCWGVEIRAGVDPVVFSNRQQVFEVIQNVSAQEGRLDTFFDGFKFSEIFKTPWIFAGQFNLNITDSHTSFLEFNYTRAEGETFLTNVSVRNVAAVEVPGVIQISYGDFSMFGAYLGHRCYLNVLDCVPLYVGGKIGLGNYQDICLNIIRIQPAGPVFNITNTAYEKQTVVSGGLQVGVDYAYSDCMSFVLQAEVVASGALANSIDKFVLDPATSVVGGSNVIFGRTGTLVSFPVTFGFSLEW